MQTPKSQKMQNNNQNACKLFTTNLLNWAAEHPRPLPWKNTKNPYIIWLSEIILQQTRVKQGMPYFQKFVTAYPTIQQLAAASEDEVMRLWEGLGYYSRARNMHFTAKYITNELNGQFPDNHVAIKKLKGVGPYTAAAIASFAFDLPHPVVDGNVYRVLSRYFGMETPIDTTAGKKLFAQLANELLYLPDPARYNQAIMDFGATHCTPANPKCDYCPMATECVALQTQKVTQLPIKSKKLKRKERFFNYLVITTSDNQILVEKRLGKDIWQNLYQFPLIETSSLTTITELMRTKQWDDLFKQNTITVKQQIPTYQQLLTHQKIKARFLQIILPKIPNFLKQKSNFLLIPKIAVTEYAFPKIINTFIEKNWQNPDQQLSLF